MEKKECLYVFNQSYFVEHYGNVSKESIDKWIDQCIDMGHAFRVNSGYEWRRFIRDIDKTDINIMFETFDKITCLEVFTTNAFNTLKNMYFKDVKKEEVIPMIKTNYDLNKEKTNTGELNSSGPWYEPEKVKAIKATIEAVMKKHNTTDIRDIDLDMLSSCINATINREKMYYDWLNEFTSDEVDEETITFAFKFLDWVILNKIYEYSSLYFKE